MPELSALQRSKTAPNPLVDSFGVSAAPLTGRPPIGRINRSKTGIRTKPAVHAHANVVEAGALGSVPWGLDLAVDDVAVPHTYGRSPLMTPRHDVREDPFSLAGFFPSRPGSPVHAVEWAWRGATEESVPETEEEEEEKEGVRNAERNVSRLPTRSLSASALDELAREVIAKESTKFGILGLARVPSLSFLKNIRANYFDEAEEDQLAQKQQEAFDGPPAATAMAIDEPFDAETLLESMHSRRVASERELQLPERIPSFGLFSPESESESHEAELGWTSALYSKLLE